MKPATIQGSAQGYGPSKVRLVILALLGVGLAAYCYTSVDLYHYDPEAFPVSNIVVSATLGTIDLLALAWLASVKVWLCADGIRYRSLLGLREMRWDMVEKFYCIGRPGRIVPYIHLMNLIPLGPYYRFKLIDSEGSRISFGNRIGRAADAGVKLVEYTYNPLFEKASSLLRTGAVVDFGAIVVDIQKGLTVRTWFGSQYVPWNELDEYRQSPGRFYVFRAGRKRAIGASTSRVPNAYVLLGLLDLVCNQRGMSPRNTTEVALAYARAAKPRSHAMPEGRP